MIRLAIKKLNYVKINLIELTQNSNNPGITYNTVIYFKHKYPKYKFYFLIGSDQLSSLNKWDNIDQLIKIQKFVIYTRKQKINQFILKKYNAIKINFKNNYYLSSTIIRQGRQLQKQIPDINNYINNNFLYLKERIKKQMNNKRFIHCLNTRINEQKIS